MRPFEQFENAYDDLSPRRTSLPPRERSPHLRKTRLQLTCPECRHRATVMTFIDQAKRFVCSHCGNREPIIDGANGLRAWSRRRRGK
jgi:hypothetical protein